MPCINFVCKAWGLPMCGVPLEQAMLQHNTLSWSRMQTLAYYAAASVMNKKGFRMLTSGPDVIKLFTAVFYECSV